ncbi:unnamed protein product, partial [Rotaria magnacalcarata]
LNNVNTQAAEQCFSWLKRYASIISALGHRRAPIFLLMLFHTANLARCHIKPTKLFDIASRYETIQDVSLSHSKRIIEPKNIPAQENVNMANDKATPVLPNERKRKNQNISSLEPTNTDWKSQVALIRKNHNLANNRREKTSDAAQATR